MKLITRWNIFSIELRSNRLIFSPSESMKVVWIQSTDNPAAQKSRRGATVDGAAINVQFKRRSATRHVSQPPFRGLKSTATFSLSLRDRLAYMSA